MSLFSKGSDSRWALGFGLALASGIVGYAAALRLGVHGSLGSLLSLPVSYALGRYWA